MGAAGSGYRISNRVMDALFSDLGRDPREFEEFVRTGVNTGEGEVDAVALCVFEEAGNRGGAGVVDEEHFLEVDDQGVGEWPSSGGLDEDSLAGIREGGCV